MQRWCKLPDCEFAMLDDDKKKEIIEKYVKILSDVPCGTEISFVMTTNRDKNKPYPWKQRFLCVDTKCNTYLPCSIESDFARDICNVSWLDAIRKEEVLKELYPKATFREYAVCNRWEFDKPIHYKGSNVPVYDFLNFVSNYENVTVILTFEPMDYKDMGSFKKLLNNPYKYLTDYGQLKFMRTVLEISVTGDTPEDAAKLIELIKTNAADCYGINFKKRKAKSYEISKRTMLSDVCTPATYGSLIPFFTSEQLDDKGLYYGRNAVTKNPIVFDRRTAPLGHGFVFGISGSGKTELVKREIEQILDTTKDNVIIVDDEGEYGEGEYGRIGWQRDGKSGETINDPRYHDRLTGRIATVEFISHKENKGFYFNPMDIVFEDIGDNPFTFALLEKQDEMIMFFEALLQHGRELNAYEQKAIARAVDKVLQPFITIMENRWEQGEDNWRYDFSINPTLADVLKELKKEIRVQPYNNDDEDRLIKAVSEAIDKNSTSKTAELAEKIRLSMDCTVSGTCTALAKVIKDYEPYLDGFCHQTNVPDFTQGEHSEIRAIQLSGRNFPTCAYNVFYAACVCFTNVRGKLNRIAAENGEDKRLWTFFEHSHTLFGTHNIADCVIQFMKRSRANGVINTFITEGLSDIIKTDAGKAAFNNAVFFRFLNQSHNDRKHLMDYWKLSEHQLECVNNQSAGRGLFILHNRVVPFDYTKEKPENVYEEEWGR